MSLRLPCQLILASTIAALFSGALLAAPISQNLPGVNGEDQKGSNNFLGMARGGRYVLFQNGTTTGRGMNVRDIKTQKTTLLRADGRPNYLSISPNGRYVAFTTSTSGVVVMDQVNLTTTTLPVMPSSHIGLSDQGVSFIRRSNGVSDMLLMRNIANGGEFSIFVGNSSADHAWLDKNPMSANGQVALYKVHTNEFGGGGNWQIYNDVEGRLQAGLSPAHQPTFDFKPRWAGVDLPIANGDIDLASSGKFIAFTSNGTLFRSPLKNTGFTVERFDLSSKFIEVRGGPSISANGRFITFQGVILQGHPEWAAVHAIDPGNNMTYPRIFRYDVQLNQLATMSMTNAGGPIKSVNGGYFPLVNQTSSLSDDGSMVEFSSSANNLLAAPITVEAESNYHAFVSNGFARNYQFVDMPNTDNGWKAYAPMTLTGNNHWEGKLTFDGVGAESFKFDVGGRLVNGKFEATPNWAINFGSGGTAGVGAANGGNIPIPGAGTYAITFNDQTLQYTIKNTAEFRIQHIGGLCVHPSGDATVPALGTPLTLGTSCVDQTQRNFRLLANNSLQQVSSGLCIHPQGGSSSPAIGTRLVLWNQCDTGVAFNPKLAFEFTPGGSIRHINSGLCVHPQGGSATPAAETQLLLWTGCDEPRLTFNKR